MGTSCRALRAVCQPLGSWSVVSLFVRFSLQRPFLPSFLPLVRLPGPNSNRATPTRGGSVRPSLYELIKQLEGGGGGEFVPRRAYSMGRGADLRVSFPCLAAE